MKITQPYLMIPQRGDAQDATYHVTARVDGQILFAQNLAAMPGEPLCWYIVDVSAHTDCNLELTLAPNTCSVLAQALFQQATLTDDPFLFIPDLYHEANRPQYHFSYRAGVMGDPTAMVYYPPRKEWHLFTISNPLRGLELCWGHAVSRDLLHWEERTPVFHHPHLIFNGVGYVDTGNLLGLNEDDRQAMVLLTPIMGRTDGCVSMTVSLDGGFTFHDLNHLAKTQGRPDLGINPICPGWGDAPRLWWNPVAERFFLTHCRWGKGNQILESLQYTSTDLKSWTRHPSDFPLLIYANWPGEGDACDVIGLPVDGNQDNKVVLVFCGLKGYALGRYAEDELNNLEGQPLSPMDTIRTGHLGFPIIFSQAPGGRAVMMLNVGNAYQGGIPNFEIGYTPNLSVPLELTVRTTPEGLRLFKNPVKELESLHGTVHVFKDLPLSQDTTPIRGPKGGLYRIKAVIDTGSAESISFLIRGNTQVYNVSQRRFVRHEPVLPSENGVITVEILTDQTCLEIFGGDGAAFFYEGKLDLYAYEGEHDLALQADGGKAMVKLLEVIELASTVPTREMKTAD